MNFWLSLLIFEAIVLFVGLIIAKILDNAEIKQETGSKKIIWMVWIILLIPIALPLAIIIIIVFGVLFGLDTILGILEFVKDKTRPHLCPRCNKDIEFEHIHKNKKLINESSWDFVTTYEYTLMCPHCQKKIWILQYDSGKYNLEEKQQKDDMKVTIHLNKKSKKKQFESGDMLIFIKEYKEVSCKKKCLHKWGVVTFDEEKIKSVLIALPWALEGSAHGLIFSEPIPRDCFRYATNKEIINIIRNIKNLEKIVSMGIDVTKEISAAVKKKGFTGPRIKKEETK